VGEEELSVMPRESHVVEDVLALLAGKYSDGATAETLAEEIGAHLVWTQTVCRQLLRSYTIVRYQKFTPGEEHLGRWRYVYLINDPERQRIRRERQLAFLDKVRANERAAAQRKRERERVKAKKKAATKAVAQTKGTKSVWNALLYYQDVGVSVETLVDVLSYQRRTIRSELAKLVKLGKVYTRKERRLAATGRKWLVPVYFPTKAAAANQLGEIDALAVAVKDAIRLRACHSLSEIAKDASADRDAVRDKLDDLIDREVVTFQQLVVNRTADGRAIIENRYYLVKE
jgi:predicted transcriptional regulator